MTTAVNSLIRQSVTLPDSAAGLYRTYVSSKEHSAMAGGPVSISAKPGAPFTAFGGELSGRTLAVVPGRQIVQAWRSSQFGDAPDSLLILTFSDTAKGGRIDLVHLGVPPIDFAGVTHGWKLYYWQPWRAFLAKRAKSTAAKAPRKLASKRR